MGFHEVLEQLAASMDSMEAAAIMAADGILLDSVSRSGEFDIQTHLIELTSSVREVGSAIERSENLPLTEMVFASQARTTIIMPINAEYFLAAAVRKGGVSGKARYLMRAAAPRIAADL
ncbi:MAG: hypothetical protein GMKNLPBB_03226 [Myxococcota bacterium]|nr:hypothetical protein [Myxococcota bacterium]